MKKGGGFKARIAEGVVMLEEQCGLLVGVTKGPRGWRIARSECEIGMDNMGRSQGM